MTEKNVADEKAQRLKAADETINYLEREVARLRIFDQTEDLHRRIREGTIDPKRIKKPLQDLIEGRYEDPNADKLPYARERVESSRVYPSDFRRRSVEEQLDFWRQLDLTRDLDASHILGLTGNRHLEERPLPQKLELDLVVPKFSCLGGYYKAAKELFRLLQKSLPLEGNCCDEVEYDGCFRPTARTRGFLGQMEAYLPGDYLVIPVNFGMRWRGASIRHARRRFEDEANDEANEFGLCHYVMAAALLTHPDLVSQYGCLGIDCAGTECSPYNYNHTRPCDTPLETRIDFCKSASFFCVLGSSKWVVRFFERFVSTPERYFGSAVGFAPAC
ncbi:MAG: hypothetical protein WCT16_02545 [Candidatus Buchananbacteria bacterium]